MSDACNLVLVSRPSVNEPRDFEEIARWIRERRPDVRAVVVQDKRNLIRRFAWSRRPTMLFSPARCDWMRLSRGVVYQGNPLSKSEEFAALARAGVPVPAYDVLTAAHPTSDLTTLGDYVVVKPDRGGRGANIRIMKRAKVVWEPQETRISGASTGMIAQRFVYTGPWPVSYRVTTLFGQVLWALRVEANHDRAPLPGPAEFRKHPGLSIVSNSKGCTFQLENDAAVIAFAENAHRAFPDIPLLGVDVVRDATDGTLYVLEVNASGYVWHFTSPLGLRMQQEFGLSLESQFAGRRKAAAILADKAIAAAR